MSLPDATAAAALDADVIQPVFLAWLDIDGDPLRANSSGATITITGASDPELDGEYIGIDHRLVSISPVRFSPGGSETVTAEISGIPGIDDDTIAQLSDSANWRGRTARLWRIIRDASGVQQGGIQPYYTGYIVGLTVGGSPDSQRISVRIESYIASLTAASNRSYLDQELYDPGDLSARAAIAIANGTSTNGISPRGGGGGGGFGERELRGLSER